jgi:hypothetical protein
MDNQPTTGLIWRSKTASAERHVTLAEGHMSTSLCLSVRQVTVYRRSTEAPTLGRISADMELGAHVAQMRMLVPPPRAKWRVRPAMVATGECPAALWTGLRRMAPFGRQ